MNNNDNNNTSSNQNVLHIYLGRVPRMNCYTIINAWQCQASLENNLFLNPNSVGIRYSLLARNLAAKIVVNTFSSTSVYANTLYNNNPMPSTTNYAYTYHLYPYNNNIKTTTNYNNYHYSKRQCAYHCSKVVTNGNTNNNKKDENNITIINDSL